MTDHIDPNDVQALIADARSRAELLRRVFPNDGETRDDARLVERLADRIDALMKERDELAAVVEKAKNLVAEAGRFGEADVDSWVNVYALKKVLYTAPADALREHDAALIESLADRIYPGPTADTIIAALRERARQVREGEA